MNSYFIMFNARRVGAIGITSNWQRTIEADNIEEAVLKLYKEFEHIRVISIVNNNTNLVELDH